jgi:prepilin-type N-terminal cleavage/methylation domain-containing protein
MFYLTNKKTLFGFTLIEMLVVMAIFSLIASFVSSRIWDTQKDARDVQRKRDLSSLRSAASVFRDQQGRFPVSLNEIQSNGIVTILPIDPSREKTYGYATGTTNYDLCFAACLEESSNVSNPGVCSSTTFDKSYINSCPSSRLHYLTL